MPRLKLGRRNVEKDILFNAISIYKRYKPAVRASHALVALCQNERYGTQVSFEVSAFPRVAYPASKASLHIVDSLYSRRSTDLAAAGSIFLLEKVCSKVCQTTCLPLSFNRFRQTPSRSPSFCLPSVMDQSQSSVRRPNPVQATARHFQKQTRHALRKNTSSQ